MLRSIRKERRLVRWCVLAWNQSPKLFKDYSSLKLCIHSMFSKQQASKSTSSLKLVATSLTGLANRKTGFQKKTAKSGKTTAANFAASLTICLNLLTSIGKTMVYSSRRQVTLHSLTTPKPKAFSLLPPRSMLATKAFYLPCVMVELSSQAYLTQKPRNLSSRVSE